MITITIQPFEVFDERSNKFIKIDKKVTLKMENSLHAISEWEKKFKKRYFPERNTNPYKKKDEKQPVHTKEESLYFIKCMVVNIPIDEIDDTIFYGLTQDHINKINAYVSDSQSAIISLPTTDDKGKKDAVPLVSERIYAWMFELQMPLELEYWNINRLMNVIQIINWDNTPPDKKKKKKMHEVARDMQAENERRLREYGTKG